MAIFLVFLGTQVARAQIEPDAQQLLQETADFLFKAEGVYVAMDVDVRALEENAKTPRTYSQVQIAARRPNLYARQLRSEGVLRDALISDGRSMYRYSESYAAWDERPAPVSMELVLANDDFANTTIIPRLLTSRGYEALTQNITAARISGERDVKGANCRIISFEQADGTGEFAIQSGEEPLLREYRFENKVVRVLLGCNRWDVRPDIAEELFRFTPIAESRKVDSVADLMKRGGTTDDLPAYKLKGELAPDIILPTLSGDKFRLSKLEHKQAIVLMFWASTERRCNLMLPSMTELTDSLQDSGVAFYTINLKENEDTVREYISKQRRQFLVALDESGETMAPYKIGPLPQMVIIDKNNVIRYVHIGLTPKVLVEQELKEFVKITPTKTPKASKKKSRKSE
ncbi:redoxin domain-containing protein [Candidatus Sumerlaeota bacterium]|nr:redoxin domain-containing protein [Candidatus Sumerlaeota bacterium]